MIHLSVSCCGRAVPLLWRVLEHPSATVRTERYLPMFRLAHRLLQSHPDVMVLANRGFAKPTQGMIIQLDGLRTQVDPHWSRGISYLKIGLRWLKGGVNKGRPLLTPIGPLYC